MGCLVDIVGAGFIGTVAFGSLITVSLTGTDAGTAGLTLSYSVMLLTVFQWAARMSVEVENQVRISLFLCNSFL